MVYVRTVQLHTPFFQKSCSYEKPQAVVKSGVEQCWGCWVSLHQAACSADWVAARVRTQNEDGRLSADLSNPRGCDSALDTSRDKYLENFAVLSVVIRLVYVSVEYKNLQVPLYAFLDHLSQDENHFTSLEASPECKLRTHHIRHQLR